jgi:hypothetical protein
MVKDRKAASSDIPNHFFALKVQKSAEHYTEAAMDEVELLDCISKERKKSEQLLVKENVKDNDGVATVDVVEYSNYVATLHDSFFHTGPNGRHMCMVFSMLGCNLLSLIKAFNYRGIPIPVVKNIVKGICKGLDFLHRKCQIIHTDLKPENVLLLFEGASEDAITNSMASMTLENKKDRRNPLVQSIHELETQLNKDNLTQEERKKLRRKLKKKRQKERKRTFGTDDGDSSGASGDEDDDDDSEGGDELHDASSFLSDLEMSRILGNASNLVSPRSAELGILPTTKRRLSHSAFVTTNFGHRQEVADAKLMELLRDSVSVKRPSVDELETDLRAAEKNGGVAEVSFMLRAFTPEEELAQGVSAALSGIPWELQSNDKSTREW